MKSVVLIEDQTAVREMLAEILRHNPSLKLAGETGEGRLAFDLCVRQKPDIVILDIFLPELNGIEVTRRLGKVLPGTRVLIFSGNASPYVIKEAVRAGAHGFVEKSASLTELKHGIDSLANGGTYFGSDIAAILRESMLAPGAEDGRDLLTAREREVLQLIAESHSTKQIAAKLNVSIKTADNHRSNLMKKLDLHDAAALTRYAYEIGLIDSTPLLPNFGPSKRAS